MVTIIILGSARREGHTLDAVHQIRSKDDRVFDLQDFKIAPYNYEGRYPGDDQFLSIAQRMLEAEHIIFATPVYWYAMSGVLKNFFDRLSDLISENHKAMGRALKGKSVSLIATGSDPELPEGFEIPFKLTADYFEMRYLGAHYRAVL